MLNSILGQKLQILIFVQFFLYTTSIIYLEHFYGVIQYLSVHHRVLQDSQDSSGFLRVPAGLHYDFGDFEL